MGWGGGLLGLGSGWGGGGGVVRGTGGWQGWQESSSLSSISLFRDVLLLVLLLCLVPDRSLQVFSGGGGRGMGVGRWGGQESSSLTVFHFRTPPPPHPTPFLVPDSRFSDGVDGGAGGGGVEGGGAQQPVSHFRAVFSLQFLVPDSFQWGWMVGGGGGGGGGGGLGAAAASFPFQKRLLFYVSSPRHEFSSFVCGGAEAIAS